MNITDAQTGQQLMKLECCGRLRKGVFGLLHVVMQWVSPRVCMNHRSVQPARICPGSADSASCRTLSQDSVRYRHPRQRGIHIQVQPNQLTQKCRGEAVEIYRVDPLVNQPVATQSEKDQCVNA